MALALGALATAFVSHAAAQTTDPFQPTFTDPRNVQRFGRPPDGVTRSTQPVILPPLSGGAGETGFDSTGSIRKKKIVKRKPGEKHLGTTSPKPGAKTTTTTTAPLSSQPLASRSNAPQVAARASYADAFKPPDAAPRPRRPLIPFQEAYDPIGIRAGDFLLRPSIEITRGIDSNPARVQNGTRSWFTTIAPELQARSQWSRHELGANLRGSYNVYDSSPSTPSLNRPSADAKVFGRLDVTRDTRFDLEGRFLVGTDNPGSPNLTAGLAKLPIYTTYGGTVGVAQRFNHLELGVKAGVDRTTYRDSQLTDGSTFSNHDRDYNQYGGQARVSYEVTPGVKPFVEIGADRRIHDLAIDRNGVQRDSRALTPKLGTTFELTRILTGELSVGYLTRSYQDPALQPLRGAVADGSLIWVASGLTTATLTASSRAEESIVAGISGSLRRDAGVQVDHAFRRWLIGTVKLGYGTEQFVGSIRADTRTSLGAALAYKFNRDWQLKGEVRQEWMRSNVADVGYRASIFMLGLKWQR